MGVGRAGMRSFPNCERLAVGLVLSISKDLIRCCSLARLLSTFGGSTTSERVRRFGQTVPNQFGSSWPVAAEFH